MRQWLVDPKIMCRKHLLGEHVEHHMFVGAINKRKSLTGYLRDNLLEPGSLIARHAELVKEMEARGYHHTSKLPSIIESIDYSVTINKESALQELIRRCPDCRSNYHRIYWSKES